MRSRRAARRITTAALTCLRKRKFETEAEALEAVRDMRDWNHLSDLTKAALNAYRCPAGKHWHVGTQKINPAPFLKRRGA